MATKQEVKEYVDNLKSEILNHFIQIKEKSAIVEEFKKVKKPYFFALEGADKCTMACQGWNGINTVCDCGNTEVCWEFDYLSNECNPEVIS